MSWFVHPGVGVPKVGNHWSITILREMPELPSRQFVNLDLYISKAVKIILREQFI